MSGEVDAWKTHQNFQTQLVWRNLEFESRCLMGIADLDRKFYFTVVGYC